MQSRASLAIQIAIPILTFLAGCAVQSWWSSRGLAAQELAIAIQVASSVELQAKYEEASKWADEVIAARMAEQRNALPPSAGRVVKDPTGEICIFPKSAFWPKPEFVGDRSSSDLVGRNVKELLVEAAMSYRTLERRYDAVLNILRDSCGFLNRPDPK